DSARTAVQPLLVVDLDRLDAADSGPHDHADAMRVGLGDHDSRVLDGLLRRSDAEVNERIALACFLRLHVLGHVEIDDRARETRGERRDVERLDRPNAALAVANVSPAFAYGVT